MERWQVYKDKVADFCQGLVCDMALDTSGWTSIEPPAKTGGGLGTLGSILSAIPLTAPVGQAMQSLAMLRGAKSGGGKAVLPRALGHATNDIDAEITTAQTEMR